MSNLRAKGYNIYFPHLEEVILFSCNNHFDFSHNNKFDYLAYVNNDDYDNKFDYLEHVNNDDYDKFINDVNFDYTDIINNVKYDLYYDDDVWRYKVPERTPFYFDLYNNKQNTYTGYICSIINPTNQINNLNQKQHKVNISNAQYINQKFNPNNKYNESYMINMYSRCGNIVKKNYKSQGRSKTPDNYQEVDRMPRGKQNPTPIGPFTETGEKPTLSGTITVGDTTNCATKPETPKNCKKNKTKKTFKLILQKAQISIKMALKKGKI